MSRAAGVEEAGLDVGRRRPLGPAPAAVAWSRPAAGLESSSSRRRASLADLGDRGARSSGWTISMNGFGSRSSTRPAERRLPGAVEALEVAVEAAGRDQVVGELEVARALSASRSSASAPVARRRRRCRGSRGPRRRSSRTATARPGDPDHLAVRAHGSGTRARTRGPAPMRLGPLERRTRSRSSGWITSLPAAPDRGLRLDPGQRAPVLVDEQALAVAVDLVDADRGARGERAKARSPGGLAVREARSRPPSSHLHRQGLRRPGA